MGGNVERQGDRGDRDERGEPDRGDRCQSPLDPRALGVESAREEERDLGEQRQGVLVDAALRDREEEELDPDPHEEEAELAPPFGVRPARAHGMNDAERDEDRPREDVARDGAEIVEERPLRVPAADEPVERLVHEDLEEEPPALDRPDRDEPGEDDHDEGGDAGQPPAQPREPPVLVHGEGRDRGEHDEDGAEDALREHGDAGQGPGDDEGPAPRLSFARGDVDGEVRRRHGERERHVAHARRPAVEA